VRVDLTYIVDSDVFITAKNLYYSFDICRLDERPLSGVAAEGGLTVTRRESRSEPLGVGSRGRW